MKCQNTQNISKIPLDPLSQKNGLMRLSYHFVGIGGIGMSAIAQVLRDQNHIVSGSDRKYDRQISKDIFSKLSHQGISLHSQDGVGINEATDFVVVSSAIEEDNPDIKKARLLNKRIIKRADLLAEMFNSKYGIAIGGTNGKTTVSCMVAYILDFAGKSPTVIVGGCIKNYINNSHLGNSKTGKSDIISIEADESDGSIVLYKPHISVITNISKDHKTIEDISNTFETFSKNTTETLIVNADCPSLRKLDLRHRNTLTYGLNNNADIRPENIIYNPFHSTFNVDGQSFEINLPGSHNLSNALAAIAVARTQHIKDNTIASALKQFLGVQRRMDIIGEVDGIKIIDDYAHNPEKVKAVINAAKLGCKRIIAIFQPHGYAPASFMKEEFIEAFKTVLSSDDILFMPEIYYAGGTANKNISSADFVNRIKEGGKNAFFFENRNDIITAIKKHVQKGDCILVMGARDSTLTEFCRNILESIKCR